jgi:hypothetical protein
VPEPPAARVRAALAWIISSSQEYRLLQRARAARTEEDVDAFYQAASHAVQPVTMAPHFDADAVREALASHRDIPDNAFRSGPKVRSGLIQLIAAAGIGYEEVGAGIMAEAIGDTLGIAVPEANVQGLIDRLQKPPSELAATMSAMLVTSYDPLQLLSLATEEQVLQARDSALILAGVRAVFIFHGLLMPDTPELRALRDSATAFGGAQMAMSMARTIHTTGGFAVAAVDCIHPLTQAICMALRAEQDGLPSSHSWEDADAFMSAWRTALASTKTRPPGAVAG